VATKIVVLLFDGFTMLDAVGPIEVLSLLPDSEILIVAKSAGVVWPDNQAVPFIAPFGLADVSEADILIVPGGPGSDAMETDAAVLEWIGRIDKSTQWTCSVCTGALVLGAAGLLKGKDATTHWGALPRLEEFGARPVSRRWVEQGNILTAAGVSAGIDMALYLASHLTSELAARAIQLGIEYDPEPPFECGSVAAAGPDVLSAVLDGTIAMDRSGRARPRLP
jgi:transcriptional regulator GlxA family with amidase domain